MITLEQYAEVYIAMTTAMGNPAQEQAICAPHGFSPPQWHEAKAFYSARMVDPKDGGRTAIAFSQAMSKASSAPPPAVPQGPPPPSDFAAANVKIYVSEFDVQMVEFWSPATRQYLVLQQGFEFDPTAEAFDGNQVHVELNGQGFAIYGGVRSVHLQPGELTLLFDAAGQARMGTARVTVRFALDWRCTRTSCASSSSCSRRSSRSCRS